MFKSIAVSAIACLALASCETTTNSVATTSPQTELGPTLSGAEIQSLIGGRSFNVFTVSGDFAGTGGEATYGADAMTVSGSFQTPTGESGTYNMPASIEGDRLCQGEAGQQQCYTIRGYQGGFAKINDDGTVQSIWTPA